MWLEHRVSVASTPPASRLCYLDVVQAAWIWDVRSQSGGEMYRYS